MPMSVSGYQRSLRIPLRVRLGCIKSFGTESASPQSTDIRRDGSQVSKVPALRSGRLTSISVSNPRRRRRSPEVKPTAFTARPPDLPPRPLMAADFAITCSLVRPGRPRYPVLVHQAAASLHASFRPHLAMTPLRFANPSPPLGWIEDSHLQAVDYARHTSKSPRSEDQGL